MTQTASKVEKIWLSVYLLLNHMFKVDRVLDIGEWSGLTGKEGEKQGSDDAQSHWQPNVVSAAGEREDMQSK